MLKDLTREQIDELVKLGNTRYELASRFWEPWHRAWVRFYKIWRCLVEVVEEEEEAEEPNTFVPYAFSMVEDLHSKATERNFKMNPPLRTKAEEGKEAEAENFSSMCRTHFSNHLYQEDFSAAYKERIITGSMAEKDVWANDYSTIKVWKRNPVVRAIDAVIRLGKQVLSSSKPEAPVMEWGMKEQLVPERVGYCTEFPSIFDVLPAPGPGRRRVGKLPWLIEIQDSVELGDLKKAIYTDPNTKQRMPVFSLEEIEKGERDGDAKKRIHPKAPSGGVLTSNYKAEAMQAMSEQTSTGMGSDDDGVDRVHLMHVYEKSGRVFTIAQGKYLIRVSQLPVAKIPFRIRVYTLDPQFIFGLGAIAPIEDMVYELNDIHNLSMANWIRIINRMLAVDVSMIVDEDDLIPRAGGKVRFNGSVHQAIRELSTQDVAPSMLAMESNSKGIMERATSAADLSPGVQGTKQSHDTATGVIEIQRNMDARLASLLRLDMGYFKEQMWMMEKIISFHQFEPMPYPVTGPDGSTTIKRLSLEDINTEGVGFTFLLEYDPGMGDDLVQRQLNLAFLDHLYKYEEWRIKVGGIEAPRANIPNVIRKLAKYHGYEDTTYVLTPPDGVIDPKTEVNMILQGGMVKVNPRENLSHHLMTHLLDRNDPKFMQAVSSGKVPPEALIVLDRHIAETRMAMAAILQNPMQFAMAMKQGDMQKNPMQGQGGAGDASSAAGPQ